MMTATACPSAERLRALSLGQLPDESSEELFEHVRTCPQCTSELETVGDQEDSLIASLRQPESSDEYQREPDCQVALAKALGALALAREPSTPTRDFLPERIGEYEIVRDLGRGGMGAVFLARHTKLGREVALKVLAAHRLADLRMRERFEAEMRAIGRLSHPNILTAHDAREVDGLAVLVTEYIDGFDLGQVLQRVGPLSVANACEIARQVAVALDYTCGQGFVHRDIKPSNVMLSRAGEVKLLDLGLARLQLSDHQPAELTGTGQAMGTADYVAPEQISDSRLVDGRTDIYGLGCTLYKLLGGQAPFPDGRYPTAFSKMTAHISETPTSIRQLRPELPTGLVKLVDSMLAKDANQRPQTAREVATRLASFAKGHQLEKLAEAAQRSHPSHASRPLNSPSSAAQTLPWRKRPITRGKAIGLALLGVLLGVCCSIVIIITNPDGTRSILELAEGSKVEIREATAGQVPAGDVLDSVGEASSRDLPGSLRSGRRQGELPGLRPATASPADPVTADQRRLRASAIFDRVAELDAQAQALPFAETPLAFAVLLDQRGVDPFAAREPLSEASLRVAVDQLEEAQPSGSLTTPFGVWYPADKNVSAPFEARIGDRKYVLASREERIDWPAIQGKVSSVMASSREFRLDFMPELADRMASLTGNNVGRHLAIVVNDRVMAAPRINSKIGGQVVITGVFRPGEARQLSQWLTSGLVDALPNQAGPQKKSNHSRQQDSTDQTLNNLKRLGLAFHNYHAAQKALPASGNALGTRTAKLPGALSGKFPLPRFSWRVALLPYLDEQELYDQFRFEEPWDSPHNAALLDKMPDVFRSPSAPPDQPAGHTNYQGLVGPRTVLSSDSEERLVRFRDVTDGTSNTLLVLETSTAVPWTKPADLTYGQPAGSDQLAVEDLKKIELFDERLLAFLRLDGSVSTMVQPIDWQLLAQMVTRDGGERIKPQTGSEADDK